MRVGLHDRELTIIDVARHAGLSAATVSRVMHDSPRVSPQARRRVQEAIAALGYTPNALARGLAMRSTRTIGVLLSSIADPFWAEVVRGIEDYALEAGYAVFIAGTYEDVEREQKAITLFRQKRVDGIVVGASSAGPGALGKIDAAGVPVVFVNSEHIEPEDDVADGPSPNGGEERIDPAASTLIYRVVGDDRQGAAVLTEHLLALGHRRIAYIGAGERASSVRRLQGMRQALRKALCPMDESLIVSTGEGANDGELSAFRLLTRESRPTALFCYDDMTALGALRAIRALNLRCPGDVSVVGFDDIPIAAYLEPALTTVRQPMHDMGVWAMKAVIDVLGGTDTPRRMIMAGELVVRASSGPAPVPSTAPSSAR
jgi:DNA-binding LacI/PurR family transcriptional regulator